MVWANYSPTMGGYDPWIIATTVPEPSTLALAGIAVVIGLGTWARRRHSEIRSNGDCQPPIPVGTIVGVRRCSPFPARPMLFPETLKCC